MWIKLVYWVKERCLQPSECNDKQKGGVEWWKEWEETRVKLCRRPAGSLMKWSDFLVCSFQLLSLQSQDIWPWLFVPLAPSYLQKSKWTRTDQSQASGVLSCPNVGEANVSPSAAFLLGCLLWVESNVMFTVRVELSTIIVHFSCSLSCCWPVWK